MSWFILILNCSCSPSETPTVSLWESIKYFCLTRSKTHVLYLVTQPIKPNFERYFDLRKGGVIEC